MLFKMLFFDIYYKAYNMCVKFFFVLLYVEFSQTFQINKNYFYDGSDLLQFFFILIMFRENIDRKF